MRGSPCSAVAWLVAERLIGRPASLDFRESLNKQSWCRTGPNTWLVEPERLPSRVIQCKVRAWVVSQKQNGFFNYGSNLRKNLRFDPEPIVMFSRKQGKKEC